MHLERNDGLAVVRMDTGKANAMNPAMVSALGGAVADLLRDPPRSLVITGTGRHFCAGLDLATLSALDDAALARFLAEFERVMLEVFLLPFPVVAAVNGSAVAGGCVLAACADHRVAARGDYKVGVNEARIGVTFPSIALEAMRALLSASAFRRAVLLGDLMGPDDALALGLIDELVDAEWLVERAADRAQSLARSPRAAFAQVKHEMRASYADRVRAGGVESRAAFCRLWASPEAKRLRQDVLDRMKK